MPAKHLVRLIRSRVAASCCGDTAAVTVADGYALLVAESPDDLYGVWVDGRAFTRLAEVPVYLAGGELRLADTEVTAWVYDGTRLCAVFADHDGAHLACIPVRDVARMVLLSGRLAEWCG